MRPIILDTNVISELARESPDQEIVRALQEVSEHTYITSVILGKLYLGVELLPSGRRRRVLQHFVDTVADSYRDRTIPFSGHSARNYARGVAHFRAIGRTISANDAYIAATAVVSGATLWTFNTRDFEGYPDLDVRNPRVEHTSS